MHHSLRTMPKKLYWRKKEFKHKIKRCDLLFPWCLLFHSEMQKRRLWRGQRTLGKLSVGQRHTSWVPSPRWFLIFHPTTATSAWEKKSVRPLRSPATESTDTASVKEPFEKKQVRDFLMLFIVDSEVWTRNQMPHLEDAALPERPEAVKNIEPGCILLYQNTPSPRLPKLSASMHLMPLSNREV